MRGILANILATHLSSCFSDPRPQEICFRLSTLYSFDLITGTFVELGAWALELACFGLSQLSAWSGMFAYAGWRQGHTLRLMFGIIVFLCIFSFSNGVLGEESSTALESASCQ